MTTLKNFFTKERLIAEIKSLREMTINNPIGKRTMCDNYSTLYRYNIVNELINLGYLVLYHRNNSRADLYKWNFNSKISLDLIDKLFDYGIRYKREKHQITKKSNLTKNKINSQSYLNIDKMEKKEFNVGRLNFTKERVILEINSLKELLINKNMSVRSLTEKYRTLSCYGVIKELIKQGYIKKLYNYNEKCYEYSWISDENFSELEYEYFYQTGVKSRNYYYVSKKNLPFKIDEEKQQSKIDFEVNSQEPLVETVDLKYIPDNENLQIFQNGFTTNDGVEYMIIKKTDCLELNEKLNNIKKDKSIINELIMLKDEMKIKRQEIVHNYESKLEAERERYEKLHSEMLASITSKEVLEKNISSVKPTKESKTETNQIKYLKLLGIKIYEKN